MKAMILKKCCDLTKNKKLLELVNLPIPDPLQKEILIKVTTCGVCHTELDEIEGRTPPPTFPMILGHQIVGRIVKLGNSAAKFKIGNRVGVAWIFSACGKCKFCLNQKCRNFRLNKPMSRYLNLKSEKFAEQRF